MVQEKDWRLENAAFLKGATLVRRRWQAPRQDWDHDHCVACWAKLAEFGGPGVHREGYATTADHTRGEGYYWICPQCFLDLQEELQWRWRSDA